MLRLDWASLKTKKTSDSRQIMIISGHSQRPSANGLYCEARTKRCRTPAANFQMKANENHELVLTDVPPCPFCGLVASEATLNHVVWDCAQNGRPAHVVPRDSLEKRLGWPLSGDACLRWFARVRQTIQEARYA